MAGTGEAGRPRAQLRRALLPLALAQFICSFAGSNMNVMINDISEDLDTTVQGVQVAITLFLLVMAALMIPGGKLSDKYGRKRCFLIGLVVYGIGALMSAVAPGLGILILGNSIFEGVGTALLIPPVYILTTLLFTEITSRARAFGVISALGGIGAAAGPLIGGVITSAISWRAAFVFQAVVIAAIIWLSRELEDPLAGGPHAPVRHRRLRALGPRARPRRDRHPGGRPEPRADARPDRRRCAGADLVLPVHAGEGACGSRERCCRRACSATGSSNLGLVTQNVQWLLLTGVSFVVSAYLQVVRGYDAIQTGVIFTAVTAGLLASSLAAERFAKRRSQRLLILTGFVVTLFGIGALLALVIGTPNVWAFAPGLLLIGLGLGLMLTPSVNVVQSSFADEMQGEISGLSRSISNLGSSLGAAIAGTILVAGITSTPERAYGLAMTVSPHAGLIGLLASVFLPRTITTAQASESAAAHPPEAMGTA